MMIPTRPCEKRSALRLFCAVVTALAVTLAAPLAVAQPMQLPGSPGTSPPAPVAPGGQAPASGAPRIPGGLQGDRPRSQAAAPLRAVNDDSVVGQALLHQGRAGRFVMEKSRGGFGLRFSAEGFLTNNLLEPCAVSFGDQAVPLESLGRPAGLPRFRLQSSVCPIVFDVLNNALLVIEPQTPCVIEAAQCRIIPRGLWAPDGRGLVALTREIERDRIRAEANVREGFRLLGTRGGTDDQRMVAREQAGFSSEREQICRDFLRETNHGFCAAKITEARAASLRARLSEGQPEARPRR